MLRELRIENFALIDKLTLPLGPGLTALTGETGAGKSIIVDALNAALGERVTSESIRGGADVARIEALFDAADAPAARAAAEAAGCAPTDGRIALTRLIAAGRSQYRINDRPAGMADLRAIGEHLADIHGQHEHQALIHERHHRGFLDAFGGAAHQQLLARYRAAWDALRAARGARERIATDERARAQRLDLLRFQLEEIDAAALAPDEDEELAAERARLMHFERLRSGGAEAYDALEDEQAGALGPLRRAAEVVEELAAIDPALRESASALLEAVDRGEDAARTLRAYLETLDEEPGRLDEVEGRLNLIAGLRRKYGDTVRAILAHREQVAREIAELEGAEQSAEELERRIAQLEAEAGQAAERLSASRRALAEELAGRVEEELRPLGMERARFAVELEADADEAGLPDAEGRRWAADAGGIDRVRFMFSANPGEELRPLSKVASGGELSRVMLTFKSLSASAAGSAVPTIVFDEVDANIGGRVAHAVAEKLIAVSTRAQVLCITHLPQIACMADRQIAVRKRVVEGRTVVEVAELAGEARVAEIARMMGESETARTAREHAAEMLAEAARSRERIRRRTGERAGSPPTEKG